MTEGTLTYNGLAVPLQGESEIKQTTATTDILTITGATSMDADFIVCQDVSGTEIFFLRQDGFMRLNPTTTVSAMGFDCRMAGSAASGVNVAGNFRLTPTATSGAQNYAIWGYLAGAASAVDGGREAVLNLYYDCATSEVDDSSWAHSFIHFDDAGSDVQKLFTFGNIGVSGGCIVAKAAAASTHGIRISIDGAVYYIMLTSCAD